MMERHRAATANAMEKIKDRITALPEFILHQILSNLSNKQAARTSALSKTWPEAWSTSPILILDEEDYLFGSPEPEEDRYKFFNFVNNTLLRYRTRNLRIHKFEINLVSDVDHSSAYRLLDQSIKTALDHGVKELDISVSDPDSDSDSDTVAVEFSPYTLPPTLFTCFNALTDLRVYKCKFPQNFASTSNAINFPFLKTLYLWLVYIDDGMLEKLFSSCPSIEKVFFYNVSGFKKFLVSNLVELKVLDIHSHDEGIEVDIQAAPSLRVLKYWGSYEKPCLLKLCSTQNLKHLRLFLVNSTHNF